MQNSKQALRAYRAAISKAWLPLVGRDRLTSSEYSLIAGWFKDGLEAALILKAIRLPEIIEGEPNERRATLLQRLLDDLSSLTHDQAQARYHEATQVL